MPTSTDSVTVYYATAVTPPLPTPTYVPAPTQVFVEYVVAHMDHAGNSVGEVVPIDLQGSIPLNDAGSVSYSIPLNSQMATRELCDPDLFDWMLIRNGVPRLAGPLESVSVDTTDTINLPITGRTWESYLEDRYMPWNPLANPTGQYKVYVSQDLFDIIRDLFDYVLGTTNSIPITYDTHDSGLTRTLTFDPSSQDTMLGILQNLAATHPGFDFQIDVNCQLNMWTPKKGQISDLVLELDSNATSITYTDNRILGNRGRISGSSSSGANAIRIRNDVDSQNKARIREFLVDEGEVRGFGQLNNLADTEISLALQKQRDIVVTVDPKGDDYWAMAEVGDHIKVVGDTGYEMLNDYFRCTQFDFAFPAEREVLTYTFSPNTVGV